MSVNRTARPIPQAMGETLSQYSEQRRQEFSAVLGNGVDEIAVSPNTDNNGNGNWGYYWIRFATGNDNGGATQYGEPQKANIDRLISIPETQGLPVRVYKSGKNGEWVISAVDNKVLIAANVNPSGYNLFRILNSLWARMLRDGRPFSPNQLNSGQSRYTVESYVGVWDGDRQFYEHGRGLSADLDLIDYVPAANLERLVLIAYLPYEDDYQAVSGATRTITTGNFDLDYINDMASQLYDYAMPKGCFRLQNSQTTVTVEDFRIDLRQWFLATRPHGFPMAISVPRTIISGYQQVIYGSLTVDSILKIDGVILEL